MKTARFAELVKQAGAPEVHRLWVAPAEDKTLQSAIRQHRVVTVHQQLRGGKKDSAAVGFHEEPSAQYLIFPKSVQRFTDRRIIAIDYDLLAADPAKPERRGAAKARSQPKAAAPKPVAETVQRAPEPVAPPEPEPVPEPEPPKPAETPASSPAAPKRAKAERAPHRAAKKPASEAKPAKESRTMDARVRVAIQRAMKELKAGKTVAAHERLSRLIGA